MNGLPAVMTRPSTVLPVEKPIQDGGTATTIRLALDSGVPMRIPLSGNRMLVLSVGLGRARQWIETDPSTAVISAPDDSASVGTSRDPDLPIARLTLVEGSALGDSVPVVVGVAMTLRVGGRTVVQVTVDAIVITAGSLRSPGQYGSTLTLRWRDVTSAGNSGPELATGDPTIPRWRITDVRRRWKRGVA